MKAKGKRERKTVLEKTGDIKSQQQAATAHKMDLLYLEETYYI